MNRTNQKRIAQKLGKSFEQHLEAYEAQLAMQNVSIADVMKTHNMHLKILDALKEKGPETIELNAEPLEDDLLMDRLMRPIKSTKNLGNTCYANAVVFYSLRFIPLFTERLHNWLKQAVAKMPRKGKRILEVFQMLHIEYMEMSGSERRGDIWSQFKDSFELEPNYGRDTFGFLVLVRQLAPDFVEGEQHDAAALLMKMLEWLKECSDILIEWVNKNGLPADIGQACFYDDYFMGKELTTTKCLGCGHEKDGPSLETSIISVLVPRGMEDMSDNDWIIKSLLRSDQRDEYHCENCQIQSNARMNTSYALLPRMLILQMQFERDMLGNEWIRAKGLAPLPLELKCFCLECKNGQPEGNHKYHLNSIVMHVGTNSESGHYFSIVRHLNSSGSNERCCRIKMNTGAMRGKSLRETWLKCNDENITVISQDDFNNIIRNESQTPHLVFYARNDIVAEIHNN